MRSGNSQQEAPAQVLHLSCHWSTSYTSSSSLFIKKGPTEIAGEEETFRRSAVARVVFSSFSSHQVSYPRAMPLMRSLMTSIPFLKRFSMSPVFMRKPAVATGTLCTSLYFKLRDAENGALVYLLFFSFKLSPFPSLLCK